MRAATRFDGFDPFRRECAVPNEELLIFTREDVVRYDGYENGVRIYVVDVVGSEEMR